MGIRPLVLCLLPLVLSANAAAGANPLSDPVEAARRANPMVVLMPEFPRMPAPAWVRPGVRLSYHVMVASVSGHTSGLKEDEEGNFVDEDDNKVNVKPTGSGEVITQVNLAELTRSDAVYEARSYALVNRRPGAILIVQSGVGYPAACADWWVHPDALKRLAADPPHGIHVHRLRFRAAGRDHDVVRITARAPRHYQSWVFDTAGGALLRYNNAVSGDPKRDRTSTLTQSTLIASRELKLPWTGAAPPDWSIKPAGLEYAGGLTQRAFDGRIITIPLTISMRIKRAGGTYWVFEQVNALHVGNGLPPSLSTFQRAAGGCLVGGPWIAPEAAAGLKAGDRLDDDPITGVLTTVAERNGDRVVIREANAVQTTDYVYDVNDGRMVELRQSDTSGAATHVRIR